MKKIMAIVGIALAAAFARADVTSATEWQDVPPDMTLGAAVEAAGARDLLDLAVYEVATNVTTNEDGTTVTTVSTNATDALVKKSEVGAATNDLANAIANKGYLTAESDPSTAISNGVAWVRGKWVSSTHVSLGKEGVIDVGGWPARAIADKYEYEGNTGVVSYVNAGGVFLIKDHIQKDYKGFEYPYERWTPKVRTFVYNEGWEDYEQKESLLVADGSDFLTMDVANKKYAKRYALVASASASISAADGCLYALTADTNGVSVTLPTALAGYAQDFVIRLVAADTNGTQIAEISGVNIDLPNGDVFADGSLKGTNYVTFTQTTKDTWSIGYFAANKEE